MVLVSLDARSQCGWSARPRASSRAGTTGPCSGERSVFGWRTQNP
jgi:hypothetical protein